MAGNDGGGGRGGCFELTCCSPEEVEAKFDEINKDLEDGKAALDATAADLDAEFEKSEIGQRFKKFKEDRAAEFDAWEAEQKRNFRTNMKSTATEIIEKTAGPRECVRKVGIISVVIYLCLVGLDFYFKANASPDRTTTENLAVYVENPLRQLLMVAGYIALGAFVVNVVLKFVDDRLEDSANTNVETGEIEEDGSSQVKA